MKVLFIFIFCLVLAVLISKLNTYFTSLEYHKLKLQRLKEDREEAMRRLVHIEYSIEEETQCINRRLANTSVSDINMSTDEIEIERN